MKFQVDISSKFLDMPWTTYTLDSRTDGKKGKLLSKFQEQSITSQIYFKRF
jgi:hypothetical protein